MNTLKQSITPLKVRLLILFVNLPLVAITGYIHYLMVSINESHGNNFIENFGLWLLVAFKIIGANLILKVIISDFKIVRP